MVMQCGVSFCWDEKNRTIDHWSYLLTAFDVRDWWVRGAPEGGYKRAEDLPKDRPLVVVSPSHGRYLPGDVPLPDYVHPDRAIYLFGHDHLNLNKEEDIGDREIHSRVYIPTSPSDMYSHQACAIVLYDRMVKSRG